MPWNNNTKKMTAPVSIADIQAAVNGGSDDIGGLIATACSDGVINKWSYIKPIHYDDYDTLEDESHPKLNLDRVDFRGNPLDNRQCHMVYGLSIPQINGSFTPAEIHATSWAYVGYPNGPGTTESPLTGTSPYRFGDFVDPDNPTTMGYSKNALPDLYGTIPITSKFFYNVENIEWCRAYSEVTAGYNVNNINAGGIELAKYVIAFGTTEPSQAQMDAMLCRCWPCILIGNYITALSHMDTNAARALKESQPGGYVTVRDAWFVDTDRSLSAHKSGFPFTTAGSQQATLVLLHNKSGSGPRLLSSDPDSDLDTHWVQLSSDQLWSAVLMPLPGACGIRVLMEMFAYTVANLGGITVVSVTGTDIVFSYSYAFTDNFTGDATIGISFDIDFTPNIGSGTIHTEGVGPAPFVVSNPSSGSGYLGQWTYTGEQLWQPGTFAITAKISTTVAGTTNHGTSASTTYVYTT